NPSSGASRASARASCSMRPSIRYCSPLRSRDGWKRYCPRHPPPKLWRHSDAAPTTQRAIFPPPRATLCAKSWQRSHAPRNCLPFSMAKKSVTNAHSAASSAKSCRQGWYYRPPRSRPCELRERRAAGAFRSASMRDVQRAEVLWMKIIGVLLILLGLTLFASPRITYHVREKVIHTGSIDVTANRQKTVVVPRVVASLIVGAGAIVLVLASRKRQS